MELGKESPVKVHYMIIIRNESSKEEMLYEDDLKNSLCRLICF